MIKIGLISDTHSFLDEKVFQYFDKCDEIWHAGDFGSLEVAERLSDFKPLRGVYGNIDGQDLRLKYPEHLKFEIEGLSVWMTHIGGYPGRYNPKLRADIIQEQPNLFIAGHSHILKVVHDTKYPILHMNPGAAGRHGFQKVRTLLRFNINNGKPEKLEVIELGPRVEKK